MNSPITIYTEEEITRLKEGGVLLASILQTLKKETISGMSTLDIHNRALDLCEKCGAKPAFLGYKPEGAKRGFPGALCVSINDEVVHGIPNENPKILKNGDVVVLDMGLLYKDMYTDSAVTLVVGGDTANPTGALMIEAATKALEAAIATVKPGVRTGSVGAVIESVVKDFHTRIYKFSLPYELGGHGIGHKIHEDPFMPNFGKKGTGPILREGMVIAIEPIVNEKSSRIRLAKDGYTYITHDGGLSVHVEHTIVVTKDGCDILTR